MIYFGLVTIGLIAWFWLMYVIATQYTGDDE